jgi:hypothetical protein
VHRVLEPVFSLNLSPILEEVTNVNQIVEPCGVGALANNSVSIATQNQSQSQDRLLPTANLRTQY